MSCVEKARFSISYSVIVENQVIEYQCVFSESDFISIVRSMTAICILSHTAKLMEIKFPVNSCDCSPEVSNLMLSVYF